LAARSFGTVGLDHALAQDAIVLQCFKRIGWHELLIEK
jgi:hypothetical protein